MLNGAAPKPCPECGAERIIADVSTMGSYPVSVQLSVDDRAKESQFGFRAKKTATIDKAVVCPECGLVNVYSSNAWQLADNPEKTKLESLNLFSTSNPITLLKKRIIEVKRMRLEQSNISKKE